MDPKRWSPTKASWLESALNRDESPRHKRQPSQQASWVKDRQSRGSVDLGRTASFKEVTPVGLMRTTAPGGHSKTSSITGIPDIFSNQDAGKTKEADPETTVQSADTQDSTLPAAEKTEEASPSKEESPTKTEAEPEKTEDEATKHKRTPSNLSPITKTTIDAPLASPRDPLLNRPKPLSPVIDFRANLRRREVVKDESPREEPEFKNIFGRLKKAESSKHVPPDELKENILKGKAALNSSGGPKKSQKVDELKDSILKQKEAIKASGGSLRRNTAGEKDAPGKFVPEAIAMRNNLTKSSSIKSNLSAADSSSPLSPLSPREPGTPKSMHGFQVASPLSPAGAEPLEKFQGSPIAPEPPKPGVDDTAEEAAQPKLPEQERECEHEKTDGAEVNAEEVKEEGINPVRSLPPGDLMQATSAPAETEGPAAKSKLAGRLNPALAGLLSRGPPAPINGSMKGPSFGSAGESSSGVEGSQAGALTHLTKGRARGPKRRLPQGTTPEGTNSLFDESNHVPESPPTPLDAQRPESMYSETEEESDAPDMPAHVDVDEAEDMPLHTETTHALEPLTYMEEKTPEPASPVHEAITHAPELPEIVGEPEPEPLSPLHKENTNTPELSSLIDEEPQPDSPVKEEMNYAPERSAPVHNEEPEPTTEFQEEIHDASVLSAPKIEEPRPASPVIEEENDAPVVPAPIDKTEFEPASSLQAEAHDVPALSAPKIEEPHPASPVQKENDAPMVSAPIDKDECEPASPLRTEVHDVPVLSAPADKTETVPASPIRVEVNDIPVVSDELEPASPLQEAVLDTPAEKDEPEPASPIREEINDVPVVSAPVENGLPEPASPLQEEVHNAPVISDPVDNDEPEPVSPIHEVNPAPKLSAPLEEEATPAHPTYEENSDTLVPPALMSKKKSEPASPIQEEINGAPVASASFCKDEPELVSPVQEEVHTAPVLNAPAGMSGLDATSPIQEKANGAPDLSTLLENEEAKPAIPVREGSIYEPEPLALADGEKSEATNLALESPDASGLPGQAEEATLEVTSPILERKTYVPPSPVHMDTRETEATSPVYDETDEAQEMSASEDENRPSSSIFGVDEPSSAFLDAHVPEPMVSAAEEKNVVLSPPSPKAEEPETRSPAPEAGDAVPNSPSDLSVAHEPAPARPTSVDNIGTVKSPSLDAEFELPNSTSEVPEAIPKSPASTLDAQRSEAHVSPIGSPAGASSGWPLPNTEVKSNDEPQASPSQLDTPATSKPTEFKRSIPRLIERETPQKPDDTSPKPSTVLDQTATNIRENASAYFKSIRSSLSAKPPLPPKTAPLPATPVSNQTRASPTHFSSPSPSPLRASFRDNQSYTHPTQQRSASSLFSTIGSRNSSPRDKALPSPPVPPKGSRASVDRFSSRSSTSLVPQADESWEAISDFFKTFPKSSDRVNIDTQLMLADKSDNAKIRTLKRQLWEITGDGKKQDLPVNQEYILYEGSMYLCVHLFEADGTVRSEVHLWCGDDVPDSAVDDAQAFSRKVAKDNGSKLEIIKQGKEPARFIQALGGILITRRGLSSRSSSSAIFMLCGRKHLGQMVFDEVSFSPSNLSSGYPFVISAMFGKLFLWKGKGSSAEEIGAARLIGMDLGLTGEFEEVAEGEEPESFFEVFPHWEREIGDTSTDYWRVKPNHERYRSRLFRIDHELGQRSGFWLRRSGSPSPVIRPNDTVQEIEPFCLKDITAKGVYVLDTFFEIYVIVGDQASNRPAEFASAVVLAHEYGILTASLQDRPFIPKSFVALGGVPESCSTAFRKWIPGYPSQRLPQVFPLNAAIEAIRSA